MTSLAVAHEATSPRTPGTVASRIREWSGGVVEFKVPVRAKPGFYSEGKNRIEFIQFALGVPGGLVNIFVHTNDYERYVGKTVIANAEIHRKVFNDGRAFLNIDLIPTKGDPTHWISVRPRKEDANYARDAVVFKTPAPLQGEIVITSLRAPPAKVIDTRKPRPANGKTRHKK